MTRPSSRPARSWGLLALLIGAAAVPALLSAQAVDEQAAVYGLDARSPVPLTSQIFEKSCAGCHGADMTGGIGPSLIDATWIHGGDDAAILKTIAEGVPDKGMPAFAASLAENERLGLLALIREKGTDYIKARTVESLPFPTGPQTSAHAAFRFETVVGEGRLDTPWSILFLSPDRMLVSERPGRLRIVTTGGEVGPPIANVPAIVHDFGQGGILGLARHPDYRRNGYLYLAYTDEMPDRFGEARKCAGRIYCFSTASQLKVIRFRLAGNAMVDRTTIWQAAPESYRLSPSFGGRLAFGSDGMLYITVGDRAYSAMEAQDIATPNGKIHRVADDGHVPPDNPFVGVPGADPTIWSFGHRNPQGLAVDPRSGRLWSSEHGPRGGDELNLIRRGGNYGWPLATFGMGYDGRPFDPAYPLGHSQAAIELTAPSRPIDRAGFIAPVVHWTPSIAVSSILFYSGTAFPAWRDSLLVTSLRQQKLLRLTIEHDAVTEQELLFERHGNVRDVAEAPDGSLYVAMNLPSQIIRMVPAMK